MNLIIIFLQFFPEDHQIREPDTAFDDRMIIMLLKIARNTAAFGKAAFFVKGDCQRTVSGPGLKAAEPAAVFFFQKTDQRPSVPFSLRSRVHSDIPDLQNTVRLRRDDTFSFYAVILQHVHRAAFEIAADHFFLLISEKKQRKILFLFFPDFPDIRAHRRHRFS